MALFKLDQVFGYQDANDIKKLWASNTIPTGAEEGEIWLDTSAATYKLKRYNGTGWDALCDLTPTEVLTKIKTVDGAGSGLDADLLDGQDSTFYRNAGNLNAGTIPLAQVPTVLTGKDADKLDGQEGSYYQNATYINAGTLSKDRLPAEALRTDVSKDVSAHVEWQDTYQARFGNDADLRLQHTGTTTYIDNYTGDMYIRQLSHGSNIIVQAEDTSGTLTTFLTVDPDAKCVRADGFLNLGDCLTTERSLVISSGAITVFSSYHKVDTEDSAAADDLITINGGHTGDLLILQPATHQRQVTLVDSTGNLCLAGNFTLTDTRDKIVLIALDVGGVLSWHELSRSNNQ